jgi:ABC-type nickel/cobalt efflux system permease component RcnA
MTTANAGTGSNNQEGDKSWQEPKAALTTVLAGVGAIVLLGIAALLILGLKLESSEATVSVATAAFGVVGSIVGAYFGVKIGSEQAAAATNQNADLTKRVQAAETKADAYALHVGDADKAQKTAQDMLAAVQSAVTKKHPHRVALRGYSEPVTAPGGCFSPERCAFFDI